MTRTSSIAAALVFLVAAGAAFAKPWTFRDRRDVSPSGRTYLVTRHENRAFTFALCARREGAAPMTPAEARTPDSPPVGRDDADAVVASGALDAPPFRARVVDRPPCAVLFAADGLRIVRDGGVVARRRLSELLGADAPPLPPDVMRWDCGFWVDEPRGAIVLLTRADQLVEVALADGAVSRPGADVVFDGFASASEDERTFAVDLAERLRPQGLRGRAELLAGDAAASIGVRLRAAVAAKAVGSDGDFGALFRQGTSAATPDETRAYAFEHVAAVLGKDAPALLVEASRLPFPPGTARAQLAWGRAWGSVGAAAMPLLVAMLADADAPTERRSLAADALRFVGTPEALDALCAAVASGTREACLGLTSRDAPAADVGLRLAKILEHGCPLDDMVVQWFRSHPSPAARAALDAALGRAKSRSPERMDVVAALDALDQSEGRAHVERPDPADVAEREKRDAKKRAEEAARQALIPPHGDATIAGRVVDENGRPTADIDVVALRDDGPPAQPTRIHGRATTDAEGRFRVETLIPGEFRVALDVDRFRDCTPGGTPSVVVERVHTDQADVALRFEMGATIRGRLVDDRGAPLARLMVLAEMIDPPMRFEYGENATTSEAVTTDAAGVFWFIRIRPGRYRLTTPSQGPKGYLVSDGGDDVPTGTDGMTLVGSTGAGIAGVVVDERGEPLGGVSVTIGNLATREERRCSTNENGKFEASGLRPGRKYGVGAVLWVPRDDLNACGGAADVAAGARDLRIVIDTGKRISFKFIDTDGKPRVGGTVRAVHVADGREVSPVRTAAGFVVRGVADGAWRIEVRGKVGWIACGEIDAGRENALIVFPE